jgi:ParB-like chromosome segregation protein Spo0J
MNDEIRMQDVETALSANLRHLDFGIRHSFGDSGFGIRHLEPAMNIEHLPIPSLSPDPANARKHPDRNLEQIKASLRRFGQQKPIVIDANNVVRAGNGTLAAAKALGWKTIAAVRSDLVKSELTAYAIADNRSAELAEWDAEILSATLTDPAIGDVGFSIDEIDKMLGKPMEELTNEELPAEKWLIVVTCKDEADQAEMLERFATDGIKCKAVIG